MKKITPILLACMCVFLLSCKNNTPTSTSADDVIQEAKETTAVVAKEGRGKISLQCNGKTYEINGVCGAVTSMGTLTIAVPDDSFPAKTFTINFTTDKMPETTSSYTLVGSVYDDKDATHASVSYTDMRRAHPMNWESDTNTGKLDFIVNGNEIKCSFSNLTLQPSMMYNKGDVDAPATISGELTIYKN